MIHPAVEPARLEQIVLAARPMTVVNAGSEAEATRAMAEAEAFFGKLTPPSSGPRRGFAGSSPRRSASSTTSSRS